VNISELGINLGQIGHDILGQAQSAPNYDNQFGSKVQVLGQEAFARSQGIMSQINNQSSILQSKAQAFEAADLAGVANFTALSTEFISAFDKSFIYQLFQLDYPNNDLPKALLQHYLYGNGESYKLTKKQMLDANPKLSISDSQVFQAEVNQLKLKGGGTAHFIGNGPATSQTMGALGSFTAIYDGNLIVQHNGDWSFDGKVSFYDVWDFNRGNRYPSAEFKVAVGRTFLPGTSFNVYSEDMDIMQTNRNDSVIFIENPEFTPKLVNDLFQDVEGGIKNVVSEIKLL